MTLPSYSQEPAPVRKRGLSWFEWSVIVGPVLVMTALSMPPIGLERDAAKYNHCKHNLKRIGLALKAYSDQYGTLPPAVVRAPDGKPLHSWRVLVLPFLGQQALYERIHLTEAWNSQHNSQLHGLMPEVFRCGASDTKETGKTHYLAVVGEECLMSDTCRHTMPRSEEGVSQSVLVGESQRGAHWMEPRDIPFETITSMNDPNGFSTWHFDGKGNVLLIGADFVIGSRTNNEGADSVAKLKESCRVGNQLWIPFD